MSRRGEPLLDTVEAHTMARSAVGPGEGSVPVYDPELESYFDPRQLPVLRVLETRAGVPVSRGEWKEALPPSRVAGFEDKRIRRVVTAFERPELANRLLVDERYAGPNWHYLLLAPGQDLEEARLTLYAATESRAGRAQHVTAPERRRAQRLRLEEALGRAAGPPSVTDNSESALILHLRASSGKSGPVEPVANCSGVEETFLYPPKGGSPLAAQLLCGGCALMDSCLIERFDDEIGVAGGLSAAQRKQLRSLLYGGKASPEDVVESIRAFREKGFRAARAAYRGERGIGLPAAELESA